MLAGRDQIASRLVLPSSGTPLAALERAVLPALRRPPCLVSFSGGLDSSFVLAVAARVARREGLPPPVPCTWRFADAPRADESAWQEDVLAALHLPDWQLWQAEDDLDLVGPVAQRLLTRHGPLHPANLHLHLPIVEQAAGGSLLTGVGGAQVLTGWRRPVPTPGVRRRLHDVAPASLRAAVRQRRDDPFPWLHPAASRQVLTGLLRERGAEPHRFDRRVVWHTARRDLRTTCASIELIATDSDVLNVNPLIEPGFVSALAHRYGRHGPGERAALLTEVASGELPRVVLAPRPKAHFLEVFLRAPTRVLVSGRDGDGLHPGPSRRPRATGPLVPVAHSRSHGRPGTPGLVVPPTSGGSCVSGSRPLGAGDRLRVGGPDVAWRETAGEIVVLDLHRSVYFGLNGTAVSLWRQLTEAATRSDLVRQLQAQGADEACATQDADDFLAELDRYGLLGREPGPTPD